jgi:ParB-like chromosome segregation protein Spo0J
VTEDKIPAPTGPIEIRDTEPMRQELIKLGALPIVTVPIGLLILDKSPRQGGENDEHTRILAESVEKLPPIVVHVPSMRVIDGTHRVRAAIMRGEKTIAAREYYGTDEDAFVLAVRMNIAHGLPLTRADRTAAAVRIIQSHPQWSDRMIATTIGLSAKTIAKARQRSTAESPQSTTRLGIDGRVRPISHAAGRLRVAALLAEKPTSSIRAIAQQAGVSSSTVHNVRQRLQAGQHPPPDHHEAPSNRRQPDRTNTDPNQGTAHGRVSARRADVVAILADLKKDPSLQTSDITKSLLRCLDRYRIEMLLANKIIEMVPTHRANSVAQLASEYVRVWTYIAAQLEQRAALTDFPTIPQQIYRPPPGKPTAERDETVKA